MKVAHQCFALREDLNFIALVTVYLPSVLFDDDGKSPVMKC
jgi:hypothetical protein